MAVSGPTLRATDGGAGRRTGRQQRVHRVDTIWFLDILAAAVLVPAAVRAYRTPRGQGADAMFWTLGLVAAAGPVVLVAATALDRPEGWDAGLSGTLWASAAAGAVLFLVVAVVRNEAVRLGVLVYPYLLALAVLAALARPAGTEPFGGFHDWWLALHVLFAVPAYGLVTLAALAAVGVTIQERAIKDKKQTRISSVLPSIAEAEALSVRLLAVSAALLAASLATGMAVGYRETGVLLMLDHKTLLVLLTFAAVVALMLAQWRTGLRGRRAARLVLLVYLLLTLGFPGVKFVTEVLLA